jgi:hypothetical protein
MYCRRETALWNMELFHCLRQEHKGSETEQAVRQEQGKLRKLRHLYYSKYHQKSQIKVDMGTTLHSSMLL